MGAWLDCSNVQNREGTGHLQVSIVEEYLFNYIICLLTFYCRENGEFQLCESRDYFITKLAPAVDCTLGATWALGTRGSSQLLLYRFMYLMPESLETGFS